MHKTTTFPGGTVLPCWCLWAPKQWNAHISGKKELRVCTVIRNQWGWYFTANLVRGSSQHFLLVSASHQVVVVVVVVAATVAAAAHKHAGQQVNNCVIGQDVGHRIIQDERRPQSPQHSSADVPREHWSFSELSSKSKYPTVESLIIYNGTNTT